MIMSARTRWVGLIVAFLAVNVAAMVILATTAGTPHTVPGYHEMKPVTKPAPHPASST